MRAIHQFTMGRYMLHINLSSGFAWKLWAKHMKNYVTFSEAALEYAIAIPWKFPEIPLFKKIPWGAW